MNKAQQRQLAHALHTALNDLDEGLAAGPTFDKLVSRIVNLLFGHDMRIDITWFLDQVYFGKEKRQ